MLRYNTDKWRRTGNNARTRTAKIQLSQTLERVARGSAKGRKRERGERDAKGRPFHKNEKLHSSDRGIVINWITRSCRGIRRTSLWRTFSTLSLPAPRDYYALARESAHFYWKFQLHKLQIHECNAPFNGKKVCLRKVRQLDESTIKYRKEISETRLKHLCNFRIFHKFFSYAARVNINFLRNDA